MLDGTKVCTSTFKYCSVPHCKSTNSSDKSLTFHKFPHQLNRRLAWQRACNITYAITDKMHVCSKHFTKDDYMRDEAHRRLHRAVDPSQNLQYFEEFEPLDETFKIVPEDSTKDEDPLSNLNGDSNADVLTLADEQRSMSENEMSYHEEKDLTTIIYLPENCDEVVTTTLDDLEKSNLDTNVDEIEEVVHVTKPVTNSFQSKQTSPNNLKENEYVTSDDQSIVDMKIQGSPNVEMKQIPTFKYPVKRPIQPSSDINTEDEIIEEVIVTKKKSPFTPIHRKRIKTKEKINAAAAVTFCAGCGQSLNVFDEELLEVCTKNIETLTAETLLKLQQVVPSNENEHTTLAKKGIEICNTVLQKKKIDFVNKLANDEELMAFTGIDFKLLNKLTVLYLQLENSSVKKRNCTKSAKERIVMCLCKLRTNLSFCCLGMLFEMTQRICANEFFVTIRDLSILLARIIDWPTAEELLKDVPERFQSLKQTRLILSCSEIEVEKKRCFSCEHKMISENVLYESVKFILGVAPSGLIIFKSDIFENPMLNNSVLDQISLMKYLHPEKEAIMVDETLDIESECIERNVTLIKFPRLRSNSNFNKNDVELIKSIISARIHVDRTLRRFKIFNILESKIPWRILPYLNNICTIIAGIINLKNPIPIDDVCAKLSKPKRR